VKDRISIKYCVGPVTGGAGVYTMSTACPVNEYKPFWGESKYADPTPGAVPAIGKLAKGKPAKPYPVMENAI
jgi:hypothetical protein